MFWLFCWQIISLIVGEELFVSSPLSVLRALGRMSHDSGFYLSLWNSFLHITAGFLLSLWIGILLAAVSAVSPLFRTFFFPLAGAMKATPVVSFIVLALILFGSRNISVPISFIMVLPIIYTSTLAGIESAETELLEMAKVFSLPFRHKIRYIYLPAMRPYVLSGVSIAIGICWKSGVAAEVIGLSANTLGKKIYESKIYLDIPELFAYTLVIIIVSIAFERLFVGVLRRWSLSLETRGAGND